MAKGKNKWLQPLRGGQDQRKNQDNGLTQKVTDANTAKQDINKAHGEILRKATESDMNAMTDDPKPEGADIESLWQIVREARDLFIAAEKRLTEETNNLAQDRLTCETEKSRLDRKSVV